MASSGWAVRKLADGVLLLRCLARMQCSLLEYSQWNAGRVLCSALCGWGGFGLRKHVFGFWVAAFMPETLRLVGRTSLAEDAVIRDSVDKKVDVSLKKAYAGTHLVLRTGIYGTYVAQSLLSDLKALNNALDGSLDCSGLMSLIERQVELLLVISFDVVWTSALTEAASVSARRKIILRDWKTDAAQRASALCSPFQGNVLFGGGIGGEIT
ncbi:hypothetical protein NDU88_009787 [Pleurodeles waltl]|uniref:Lamina-associated polypeptide 2 alpha C-terminal domain-containing protein n=1 Tax=Pleurodeles waltl TaxID=8319 RepID=A0AAV7QWR4_PLEWA|nr:hypothetical protein NDU88_009787 [Pleurodeles waltl]